MILTEMIRSLIIIFVDGQVCACKSSPEHVFVEHIPLSHEVGAVAVGCSVGVEEHALGYSPCNSKYLSSFLTRTVKKEVVHVQE